MERENLIAALRHCATDECNDKCLYYEGDEYPDCKGLVKLLRDAADMLETIG